MLSKFFAVHSKLSVSFSIWEKDLNLIIFKDNLLAMFIYQLSIYDIFIQLSYIVIGYLLKQACWQIKNNNKLYLAGKKNMYGYNFHFNKIKSWELELNINCGSLNIKADFTLSNSHKHIIIPEWKNTYYLQISLVDLKFQFWRR